MVKNESRFVVTIAGKEIEADRPEPIVSDIDVIPYNRRMGPRVAVDALVDGAFVLPVDFYSSGLAILNELKRFLETKYTDASFQGQRDLRSVFRELSHRLLLEVSNNRLRVKKAPEIGWLKQLYPELNDFLLPLPQIQGLNSSWQWHQKGISIPVLERKIHPFYGTYFPTRFEHLKLFETWLKQYKGEKKSAFDIGAGCGVLSFQLLKHGFGKVYATDSNPNAIIGLTEDLTKNRLVSKIDLKHGDLFVQPDSKTELIVFNPPWLPASHQLEGMDRAIYYDASLFPRFFAEAPKYLKPGGRVVLLFSNLLQLINPGESHPIEKELSGNERLTKELFMQMKVGTASKKTTRDQNWRAHEHVELWVLRN